MKSTLVYAVMAGGRGTRLWPLSRHATPKQLLHIDGASLLDHTLSRMPAQASMQRIVVTTQCYAASVTEHIARKPSLEDVQVLAEPYGRNTAAAVAQAVVYAHRAGIDIVACVPADHIIDDMYAYRIALHEAITAAQTSDGIVLLGAPVTEPSPLYGYIIGQPGIVPDGAVRPVERFHEKPSRMHAAQLIQQYAGRLWYNCGIFVGRTQVLYDLLSEYAPQILHAVTTQDYTQCPAVSFDTLVVEHAPIRSVVPGSFSWADIGSLELFAQQLERATSGQAPLVVTQDSPGCTVVAPGKLVVLSGVQDIVVVDTPDVVLVMKKDEQRRMDELLRYLENAGYERYT